MVSKREREAKDRFIKMILGAIAGLIIGYYLLEYVANIATWRKLPLGQTFYIVVGCIFIAVSGIVIFLAVKNRYFPKKKKRKGSPPVFLKDTQQHKPE